MQPLVKTLISTQLEKKNPIVERKKTGYISPINPPKCDVCNTYMTLSNADGAYYCTYAHMHNYLSAFEDNDDGIKMENMYDYFWGLQGMA